MAELLVQRKKKSPLPWIILALVVIGIIGYMVWKSQQHPGTTMPAATDTTTHQAPDNGANRNP